MRSPEEELRARWNYPLMQAFVNWLDEDTRELYPVEVTSMWGVRFKLIAETTVLFGPKQNYGEYEVQQGNTTVVLERVDGKKAIIVPWEEFVGKTEKDGKMVDNYAVTELPPQLKGDWQVGVDA